MHVLMTADTVGGVWTYTQELVSGLIQQGIRVTLVSLGKLPSPEQSAWIDALPELDYRPTDYRLEWMQDSERDVEESGNYLVDWSRLAKEFGIEYPGLHTWVERIINDVRRQEGLAPVSAR